jgi:BirA family biotin operon repressor/biotin-[acetyl-CoA-carboxylase] ligase
VLSGDVLDADVLRRELLRPGGLWSSIEVVPRTGSTNADLAARARAGAPAGSVLVTDFQDAGRGRRGRSWVAPRGSGIAMSVLLRPTGVPAARWTWLPLLTGLAVVEGLRRAAGVPAVLKWPNDVLVEDRKLCGVLAERVETPEGPACVLGVGVNVWLAAEELPVPTATSLALLAQQSGSGRPPSRNLLIATILAAFELILDRWEVLDDDALFAAAYLERCDTIGRRVRVLLADESVVEGQAEALDHEGRLVVRTATGVQVVGAGDVVHLRS